MPGLTRNGLEQNIKKHASPFLRGNLKCTPQDYFWIWFALLAEENIQKTKHYPVLSSSHCSNLNNKNNKLI